jgi:hypothetical protein
MSICERVGFSGVLVSFLRSSVSLPHPRRCRVTPSPNLGEGAGGEGNPEHTRKTLTGTQFSGLH